MDNFALFTAGGRDFLVLNLEWEAPQYGLDWAAQGARRLPRPDRDHGHRTVSWSINGPRRTVAERPGGTPRSTIWTNFVAKQCSIRLVLSGHYHNGDLGEANRSDLNQCGQPVQQILTDYQDRANGGDGWLRYYTFDPAAGTMTATHLLPQARTSSRPTPTRRSRCRSISAAPQPAPFAPIATVHGHLRRTAATTWTGLEPDTATSGVPSPSDGTTTTTSADLDGADAAERRPRRRHLHPQRQQRLGCDRRRHTPGSSTRASTSYSVDGAIGRHHHARRLRTGRRPSPGCPPPTCGSPPISR